MAGSGKQICRDFEMPRLDLQLAFIIFMLYTLKMTTVYDLFLSEYKKENNIGLDNGI